MVAVNDIIRIRDCQSMFGQTLCNVFYYVVQAWTGNSTLLDVLTEYQQQVVSKFQPLQTPDLIHVNLRADNVTNDLDFAEKAISDGGTYTDSISLPVFVAIGYKLTRSTKLTRPGAKRVAGISETLATDGQINPVASVVDNLGVAFAQVLTIDAPVTNSGSLAPVIVGRQVDGSLDLTRTNLILSGEAQVELTSQVSRKVGR